MDNEITQLPITIFSIENFNELFSKGRARIFYSGKNRNRTYISEEFAEKLISTLPYAPVKGIWDEDLQDFTDHGFERTEGKIYGVVLENPNFSWETVTDKDGVTRTYACADVLVYTGIYPEASQIVGKSLSMELLPASIKGDWQLVDGEKYFVFEDASFAGLQALGNEVEPCFEGAQFFALYNNLQKLYTQMLKQSNLGGKKMEMNFKCSDKEKYSAIFNQLNPNFNEEGNWEMAVSVCDVLDDYALCYNHEDGSYFKQAYTKENDVISFGEQEKTYVLSLTESEAAALNSLKEMNEGTFEKIDECYSALKTAAAEVAEKDSQIETLNASINSLNETIENDKTAMAQATEEYTAKVNEINNTLSDAQTELNSLKEYKHQIETSKKQEVIAKYSKKLDDEIVSKFSANLDAYEIEGLEKELSYELVKNTPSLFTNKDEELVPKDAPLSGIEAILENYKK